MSIKILIKKAVLLLKIICNTPNNLLKVSYFKKKNKNNRVFVLFTHNVSYSGAPFLALNIGKTIIQKHNLICVSLRGGELDNRFKESFDCYIRYPSKIVLRRFQHLNATIFLNSILSAIKIKTLKSNNNKVVSLIHEMPYTIIESLHVKEEKLKQVRELSDVTIFPTGYVRDIFINEIGDFKNKVIVRPQGVFHQLNNSFSKEESKMFLKERYGIDTNTFVYMGCGNITERKGFDIFYKLACDYSYDKKIVFIWVGDDYENYVEHVKKVSGKQQPNNLIIAYDIRDKNELAKFYISSEFLLLTSRQDPFPSTVLEAFSLGRPVIAFDKCGGYVEIVNNDTGFLIDQNDIDAFAKTINDYDSTWKNYNKVSYNCKNLIDDRFNFNNYVDFLVNL